MRRLFVIVALAALALPGAAQAKELVRAEVCGASGCTAITDKDDLRLVPGGGDAMAGPPAASPYYTVELTVDAPDERESRWTIYYIPKRNLIASLDTRYRTMTYFPIYGAAIGFMHRLAATIEPFPVPQLTAVRVGDKPVVGDPSTYLRLFATQSAGIPASSSSADDWLALDLRSARRSPWTAGTRDLMFSPSENLLERGGALIVLPDDVASSIEARTTLAAGGGRALLPWLVLGALLLALAALAGLGAYLRRRAAPAPAPVGAGTA